MGSTAVPASGLQDVEPGVRLFDNPPWKASLHLIEQKANTSTVSMNLPNLVG